ncbi:ESX secretion-associated protein EspG [Saccharopolyspora spinosa]|uniref:ESAT-6 protein secretion system EspG family protein n=1 Tax=Saccharopolyspora spinosa TaxID=60894 RepID=A0A2N3Y8H9_SACSN|nr:ESX secretion-associated protein EspG [Saccharopolyspora spinosa]PKW19210.1 ESAT-6 protein secretion system EspG family protein [Saccharopolyspora spinosa]
MLCSLREFDGLLRDSEVGPEIAAFLIAEPQAASAGPRGERWAELAANLARASVFGFAQVSNPGEADLRAVVAVGNHHAARVLVRGESVTTQQVRPDAPWPALVGCLPDREPAGGCEVTVPTRVLAEARAEAAKREDRQVDWLAYELKRRQVPPEDAQAVGDLMRRADGMTAKLSVGLRVAAGAVRSGPFEIEVHHAPTGRAALIPESPDDTFTVVAPAGAYLLGRTLQEYVESLWVNTSDHTQPLPR